MNSQAKFDSSLDYSDLVAELRSGEDGLEYASADALETLMARIADLEKMLAVHRLAVDVDALKARIARLESALREAYEVYAGSDGFIAETAAEGYLQQLISEMVAIIGAGLKK